MCIRDRGTGDPFLDPVSRKVRKALRRIGLPVSDLNEILTAFGEGYTPLLLSEEEFALFGHAVRFDADGIGRGVPDVSVHTEDGRTCTTNENGFYEMCIRDRYSSCAAHQSPLFLLSSNLS